MTVFKLKTVDWWTDDAWLPPSLLALQSPAAAIGQTAADKKWDVPGKIANRKGRPEPKKKKQTAAADETSERRKSTVSLTTWNYRRWWWLRPTLNARWPFFLAQLLTVFRCPLSNFYQPISQVRVQPKCPSDWIERGYELLALWHHIKTSLKALARTLLRGIWHL